MLARGWVGLTHLPAVLTVIVMRGPILEGIVVWSLFRRAFCRLAEFLLPAEIAEALHMLPGFHHDFFGRYCPGYVLIICAASVLFDLIEISTRPEPRIAPCESDEPRLDFDERK